jgi:D-sedoheptulose 7-phosphate isomerase
MNSPQTFPAAAPGGDADVTAAFGRRDAALAGLAAQAGAVAGACHDMALRFHRGGKLVVFGTGGASTDAQHVAVEFVHPVIVGKRALPAISLTADIATVTGIACSPAGVESVFSHQIRYLAEPADIALGIGVSGDEPAVIGGLALAQELGLLAIALVGGDGGQIAAANVADHVLTAASADPRVIKETQVTAYHVLWELVHVFFEQPGVLDPGVLTR